MMSHYVKLTALSIETISISINSFRFADISSLVRDGILIFLIYFNIGYKLNR